MGTERGDLLVTGNRFSDRLLVFSLCGETKGSPAASDWGWWHRREMSALGVILKSRPIPRTFCEHLPPTRFSGVPRCRADRYPPPPLSLESTAEIWAPSIYPLPHGPKSRQATTFSLGMKVLLELEFG